MSEEPQGQEAFLFFKPEGWFWSQTQAPTQLILRKLSLGLGMSGSETDHSEVKNVWSYLSIAPT
jgi:hypothetical protein